MRAVVSIRCSSYTLSHEVRSGICALRPQRQLRGREGAVPVAADGDPLRAPGHAGRDGHRLARRRAPDSRGARRGSLDEVRDVRSTARAKTCSSTSKRLLAESCGEDVAGRLHTARSRNDIDMTMYRMRQREFVLDLVDARARAAREPARSRRRSTATTIIAAHTHTQPAQPTTVAHYLLAVIEQLERDTTPPARGLRDDEPQPARRVCDHRHGVSDRSRADERAARVRRADRQHVRQHRDRRLPAREHVRRPRSRWPASGASCRTCCSGARRR